MECSLFSDVPTHAVIADENLLRTYISKGYPWITTTLEMWATVIKMCKLKDLCKKTFNV